MNFSYIKRILYISLTLLLNKISYSQNESFLMTQIGSDFLLNKPFDLHYGPDDYLWVTEKNGVVVRINPINGQRDELITLSDISFGGNQDGLLGMAFHNEFKTGSPYVYLSYTHKVSGQNKQKLVRYTYNINQDNGYLSSPLVIFDNLPSSDDHQSGRLIFGPDKKLYHTIGDQAVKVCASNLAQFLPTQEEINQQNWQNYPGKILRLNLDGSIPEDNPILNGVKSHVYSYGHRNPQGLVYGSNGILYSDEHGPSSDDEINIINSGKNYGWPYVAGLKDNLVYDSDGCHANETSFTEANYQDPIISLFPPNSEKDPNCTNSWMCRPNIAPSSIAFYKGEGIPNWKNSLLITSLKRGKIYRVQLNEEGTSVIGNPTAYFYTTNRYRDIAIDPDGKSIYVITDESGKTADESGMNIETTLQHPGAILKFTYQESMSVNQIENDHFLKIWQHATQRVLYIDIKDGNNHDFNAELINSMGQVVMRFSNLEMGINQRQIEGITPGFYILNLKEKNNFWKKRVFLH
ncbi:PQQ-dependent sugar dehydrogenase [Wenyingzhuangia sp. chi5]|uniref:PQQ-dependent sugar dehydrogenase n=1 Tax=Wenyingzhuangia gilva TaxID=3057677 RepID=A0ABT8VSX0_9FLAO|nr:PQQ-dependent sugar dehydrogenase [Wenyingzhuangia sp. chi5]MDO3695049.1 PQQ-dependent sugar dehydrogenase [Wenyingzhuangia sp. chi5]